MKRFDPRARRPLRVPRVGDVLPPQVGGVPDRVGRCSCAPMRRSWRRCTDEDPPARQQAGGLAPRRPGRRRTATASRTTRASPCSSTAGSRRSPAPTPPATCSPSTAGAARGSRACSTSTTSTRPRTRRSRSSPGTRRSSSAGPPGEAFEVAAGDVLVLPAGTGHRRATPRDGFSVVGAYPPGQEDYDLLREDVSDAELRRRASGSRTSAHRRRIRSEEGIGRW